MSILLVEVVPEGIILGADRNITITSTDAGRIEFRGLSQRRKVLRWPDRKALVGYVGEAEIGGAPTDDWLYDFIGRHVTFSSLRDLSEALRSEVEHQRAIDEKGGPPELLVLHLAGFEERDGVEVPEVWYVRNAYDLGPRGYKNVQKAYKSTEELWEYFPGYSPATIRQRLKELADGYEPFWFHQGEDLATFNRLEAFVRAAFKQLCEQHPDHSIPDTLGEWEAQVRMSVLTYGSYFQAFKGPTEQLVGGGVDTEAIAWP